MKPSGQEAYRCRRCGAPIQVGPDTVVVVCPYCGTPNWIRGEAAELLALKPPLRDEVLRRFSEFAGRDPDLSKLRITPLRAETVLIPFYSAKASLRSDYEARGVLIVEVTRTRRVGEKTVTEVETRRVPFHVRGVYTANPEGLLLARRNVGEDAVDELARHYLGNMPGQLSRLNDIEWKKGEYEALAAEIGRREAQVMAEDDLCDWMRSKVEERIEREARSSYHGSGTVSRIEYSYKRVPCRIESLAVEGPLFLPLSKVFYSYEGKIYRAYLSGWDLEPLLREEPFTQTQRVVTASIGGIIAGLLAGLSPAAYLHIQGSEGLLVAGLLAGAGAAAGFLFSRAALRDVRIERGRGGLWIRSMPELLEV